MIKTDKGLLIKGGRIVDPANGVDEVLDLLIENGKISKLGKGIKENGRKVILAKDRIVAPGLIDMHVHLRQPGREDEETFLTGSRAALKGGFTTVLAMPNTTPPIDNHGVVEYIYTESKKIGLANIYTAGCATINQEGEFLTEIGELYRAGARAITDDGKAVRSAQVMRLCLEYSSMFDLVVITHCEDEDLSGEGVMHEGYISTLLGLRGIPWCSEAAVVARDIQLAELTRGRLHVAHVSCGRSVELISRAKKSGVNLTCEVAPHHFTLTDEALKDFDTNAKMKPPLRPKEDVDELKRALAEGTIDVIATDHAPHAAREKDVELDSASFGCIGLETALSLCIMELIDKKIISWPQLIEKLSVNPAKVLRLDGKGGLAPGKDADVTIIDPKLQWTVEKEALESKSKNSPFLGWRLKGKATDLIAGGKVVMKGGEIIGER